MSLGTDLDVLHKGRIDAIMKKLTDEKEIDEGEFFVSERVTQTILSDKLLLHSFDIPRILSGIPFYDNLYVAICPRCVREADFGAFSSLVARGAITPILTAPYASYPQPVVDAVFARDHLSAYEYRAYRYLNVLEESRRRLCTHCVGLRRSGAFRAIRANSELEPFKKSVPRFFSNLHPYIHPDFTLLDTFVEALKLGDKALARQTLETAEAVYVWRTSRAFAAPLSIDDKMLSLLPKGVGGDIDEAIEIGDSVQREVAEGLGLKIPASTPIDQYVEIARDYRPELKRIVARLSNSVGVERQEERGELLRNITRLNGDILKTERSLRYVIYEAGLEFYAKNAPIINAALMAGALGLGHANWGCAVGAAASGGATFAAKQKWISGGAAGKQLVDKVRAQIQPYTDVLVAGYLGTSHTAVNVLSLRKGMRRGEAGELPAKQRSRKAAS